MITPWVMENTFIGNMTLGLVAGMFNCWVGVKLESVLDALHVAQRDVVIGVEWWRALNWIAV